MVRFRHLVSLLTQDHDYQREQAASAKAAGQEFGLDVEIVYAGNDAITQSTQLLKAIQADATLRPHAVIVEPLGATPFPKVASTAASAGVGWAVVNREAEYTSQLRVGRIQGTQLNAFCPTGVPFYLFRVLRSVSCLVSASRGSRKQFPPASGW